MTFECSTVCLSLEQKVSMLLANVLAISLGVLSLYCMRKILFSLNMAHCEVTVRCASRSIIWQLCARLMFKAAYQIKTFALQKSIMSRVFFWLLNLPVCCTTINKKLISQTRVLLVPSTWAGDLSTPERLFFNQRNMYQNYILR